MGRQARTLAAVKLRPGHSGGWYSRIIPRSTSQSFPSTGPNWIPPINVSMPSPISASVAGPERRISLSHPCCILPLWISAASYESSNRCPPVRSCHGSRPRWNQSRSPSLRRSLPKSERDQEPLQLDGNRRAARVAFLAPVSVVSRRAGAPRLHRCPLGVGRTRLPRPRGAGRRR